jgi:hypothetical protein
MALHWLSSCGALAGLWRESGSQPVRPAGSLPLRGCCCCCWLQLRFGVDAPVCAGVRGCPGMLVACWATSWARWPCSGWVFAGSGLMAILLLLLGLAWAMDFSWLHLVRTHGGHAFRDALVGAPAAREAQRGRPQARRSRRKEEREVEVQEAKVERNVEHDCSTSRCYIEPRVLNVPVDLPSSPAWPPSASSRCSRNSPTPSCRRSTCWTQRRPRASRR